MESKGMELISPMFNNWPRIGVGAIVLRPGAIEAEILLVKRMYPPFRGYWSIPGGHLNPGESLLEAARRELLEETGIDAEPIGIADIHELIIWRKNNTIDKHYILIDIAFRYKGGRPRPSSDALDARFFGISVALKEKLTPSTRKLVRKLAENPNIGTLIIPVKTICFTEKSCE